ncbi:MAG: hypothetical protein HRU21_10585 [Pseudomonadales bacterium]|nr:hypothetical protein [Pseudomonadales bacterium]
MSDIKLDPATGDLDISNNQLHITSEGVESVAQQLRIRLRFFFQEWVLDRSKGTKWFEIVLRKDVDKFAADQEVRQVILNTPNIREIVKWESTIDASTRGYEVLTTVRTTFGTQETFSFTDLLNPQNI